MEAQNWDKWCWIELIGFDNRLPDFGVEDFLGRMEKKPQYIVLLARCNEMVHRYSANKGDFKLDAEFCSYGGRPYNQERQRQEWTASQLRGLLAELRKHGIGMILEASNSITTSEDAQARELPEYDEWVEKQHPELMMTLNTGRISHCICPWKTMSDGTPYEDYFSSQLELFLNDFDFAGFMIGDGLNTSRGSLIEADFSEEMTGRFEKAAGVRIPPGSVKERADYIIAHHRLEWCMFLTSCQSSFLVKISAAVHRTGKMLTCLSAWVKDPLEAIWRYGTDYRVLEECKIDALVVESSAGTIELEGWNQGESTSMLDRNRAMLLCLKACMPNTRLLQLHCVKDDEEEYCVLRHSAPLLASEIFSLSTMFFADTGRTCLEGVMACLSDGISREEWQVMDETWKLAFSPIKGLPESPLLLWSSSALDKELEEYSRRRRSNTPRTLAELIAHGLPLAWSGTPAAAEKHPEAPLLIIHPAYWSEDELRGLLSRQVPVLLAGVMQDGSFGAEVWSSSQCLEAIRTELLPNEQEETLRFWHTLPDEMPQPAFWDKCVSLFRKYAAFPVRGEEYKYYDISHFQPEYLRVWSFSGGMCLAANTSHYYLPSKFQTTEPVKEVRSLTFYPCLPVKTVDKNGTTELAVKIPPLGIAVLEVASASPRWSLG